VCGGGFHQPLTDFGVAWRYGGCETPPSALAMDERDEPRQVVIRVGHVVIFAIVLVWVLWVRAS